MIAIVNYGSGNIQAIANIYGRLNIEFVIASRPQDFAGAERVLLPGVGAFDQAMGDLGRSGLRSALDRVVLEDQRPVLGICVGMQMLARRSDEGKAEGLGWIDAEVRRFDPATIGRTTCLPHIGWNSVEPTRADPLFDGIDGPTGFYFLHSYHVVCCHSEDQLASTDYGAPFTSALRRRNVYGVQFHPEKSHQNGVQLLKTFAQL